MAPAIPLVEKKVENAGVDRNAVVLGSIAQVERDFDGLSRVQHAFLSSLAALDAERPEQAGGGQMDTRRIEALLYRKMQDEDGAESAPISDR